MALIFKPNVRIDGIQDQTIAAILTVAEIFDRVLRKDCVITSITDDTVPPRGEPSLHDDGLAVDFRLKHLDASIRPFVVLLIKGALNAHAPQGHTVYDVVHEFAGTEAEHCHVEYQPH